jgi:hypothetical protein
MVLNRIKTIDPNQGTASITSDIENVLRKIEASIRLSCLVPNHVPGRRRLLGWMRMEWRACQVFRYPGEAPAEKKLLAHNFTALIKQP